MCDHAQLKPLHHIVERGCGGSFQSGVSLTGLRFMSGWQDLVVRCAYEGAFRNAACLGGILSSKALCRSFKVSWDTTALKIAEFHSLREHLKVVPRCKVHDQ